jgi:hypothetical protein
VEGFRNWFSNNKEKVQKSRAQKFIIQTDAQKLRWQTSLSIRKLFRNARAAASQNTQNVQTPRIISRTTTLAVNSELDQASEDLQR